jgi:hypothetical protein
MRSVGPAAATAATPALSAESAASSEPAAPPAFGFGPGFVDGERPPAKFLAIELSNGLCGGLVVCYLHKSKAAGLAGVAVSHDPHLLNFPERTEHISEFVFAGGKWKVAYK